MIKSKYTMIMLKLIEAKRFGMEIRSISKVQQKEFKNGSREEKAKNWTTEIHTAGIECGIEGGETKNSINHQQIKYHEIQSKVMGYQILVTDMKRVQIKYIFIRLIDWFMTFYILNLYTYLKLCQNFLQNKYFQLQSLAV